MILPFSTQLNGKATYFVEKILRGLLNEHAGKVKGIADYIYTSGEALKYNNVDEIFTIIENRVKPKLHTIREDKNNRWKVGTMIDFFINCRQKNMFRFAPRIPVVSVQEIEMIWTGKATPIPTIDIWIDGECYVQNYEPEFNSSQQRQTRMEELAYNDGFDTVQDFLEYFNEDFKGKLIHWTDKRY